MSIQQLRKRVEALEKAHPVHSKEDEMQELRRRAMRHLSYQELRVLEAIGERRYGPLSESEAAAIRALEDAMRHEMEHGDEVVPSAETNS